MENSENSDFVLMDNLDIAPMQILNKPKIPNIEQNICPICTKPGNMIDRIIYNNLFVRLECGNLVCFDCWKQWRLTGYKCPVCNKRSHKEQEILLTKEEFTELYSDNHNKYTDENKITLLLEQMGRINHNFIPNQRLVQIEDTEVELRRLYVVKDEIKKSIEAEEVKIDDFNAIVFSKLFNKFTEIEERIKFLNGDLCLLSQEKKRNTKRKI